MLKKKFSTQIEPSQVLTLIDLWQGTPTNHYFVITVWQEVPKATQKQQWRLMQITSLRHLSLNPFILSIAHLLTIHRVVSTSLIYCAVHPNMDELEWNEGNVQYCTGHYTGTGMWDGLKLSAQMKLWIWFSSLQVGRRGSYLPNRLGLGNLHDSLYVEYWGWEYGLPEKSPPVRKDMSH